MSQLDRKPSIRARTRKRRPSQVSLDMESPAGKRFKMRRLTGSRLSSPPHEDDSESPRGVLRMASGSRRDTSSLPTSPPTTRSTTPTNDAVRPRNNDQTTSSTMLESIQRSIKARDTDISSSNARTVSKSSPKDMHSNRSTNTRRLGVAQAAKTKPIKKPTPVEYARIAQESADRARATEKSMLVPQFLAEMNIFYCGGDLNVATESTVKRMDLIVRYGGTLVDHYDSSIVTHIIADCQAAVLLKTLGLKSLKDIPYHIPTLDWNWIADAIGKWLVMKQLRKLKSAENVRIEMEEYWKYAKYASRIDAGVDEEGTRSRGIYRDEEDLLAQFYPQAMAECDNQMGRYGEDDETEESDLEVDGDDEDKTFVNDGKEGHQSISVNQDIIDKLEDLRKIHKARASTDDKWKAYSYSKSIRSIRAHPTQITSYKDARSLPGVGDKTAQKIMEIIETGNLRRLQLEKTNESQILQLFSGIYGVGKKTAIKWYTTGARTLDDLKGGKYGIRLSGTQEIGIQYYDDINTRMSRKEVKEIFDLVKPIALSIDPKLFIEATGSYRRGQPDCGDVDIVMTRNTDDGKSHEGVLLRLIEELHKADILTEDLAVPENGHDLESTYHGLCHFPGTKDSRRYRIDFLTFAWRSRGAGLLYYTGDDIFNRSMRLRARSMGYSLTSQGLFSGVIQDPSNQKVKLNRGTLLPAETEEDIFKFLGVPWKEPRERVRYTATVNSNRNKT